LQSDLDRFLQKLSEKEHEIMKVRSCFILSCLSKDAADLFISYLLQWSYATALTNDWNIAMICTVLSCEIKSLLWMR